MGMNLLRLVTLQRVVPFVLLNPLRMLLLLNVVGVDSEQPHSVFLQNDLSSIWDFSLYNCIFIFSSFLFNFLQALSFPVMRFVLNISKISGK